MNECLSERKRTDKHSILTKKNKTKKEYIQILQVKTIDVDEKNRWDTREESPKILLVNMVNDIQAMEVLDGGSTTTCSMSLENMMKV